MSRSIDYYFSVVSPWAYIGHATFMELTRRHDVSVNFKPVALGAVFPQTGGLPLAKRAPARQRYRLIELQRWRDKRGVRLNLHPKHWPFDAAAADCLVIAIAQSGADPDQFLRNAFPGVWADERNLADEATLVALAEAVGLPGAELLARSKTDAVKAAYQRNVEDALKIDAFGSPCYVLNGEVFWGQDRIELLGEALSSGRPPYRHDV